MQDVMLNELLHGFHVLIVSDSSDMAKLFAAVVTACGATVMCAATVFDAVKALRTRPHAVLLDVALAGDTWAVPVEADGLKIPVVALTLRCADPRDVAAHVRAFATRALHSTDIDEVCRVLHEAACEAT